MSDHFEEFATNGLGHQIGSGGQAGGLLEAGRAASRAAQAAAAQVDARKEVRLHFIDTNYDRWCEMFPVDAKLAADLAAKHGVAYDTKTVALILCDANVGRGGYL